jgi:hypothetical protein
MKKMEDYLEKANKVGIKEQKEKFKKEVDKVIDSANEAIVIITDKQINTLGFVPYVMASIFSAIEEIANYDSAYKSVVIENTKKLLEKLEDE